MLHSFTCANFYSIKDEASFSFLTNKRTELNDVNVDTLTEARVSLIEAVVGPNASGKTSLMKGLPFFKWLVVDSFDRDPSKELLFKPFASSTSKTQTTKLSSTFEIDANIYTYSFRLTQKRIHSEKLSVKNLTKEKYTTKKLFSRAWNVELDNYIYDLNAVSFPKESVSLFRANASMISTAYRLNNPLSQEIVSFWDTVNFNINETGYVGDVTARSDLLRRTFDFFSKLPDYRKKAELILSKMDIGFSAFDFEEEDQYRIVHHFTTEDITLPYQYESAGTNQLIALLGTVLISLEEGGVAIIDEIDANLHPDMVAELVGLFENPETNPNQCQLLFSTHSHQILSELEKYQIILTEKNDEGSTEVWRLDDLKGVRADDNYFAKYTAGAYGAKPQIG